jgi:hypothetical protein
VVAGLYPRPVFRRGVYYAGDKRVSAYPCSTDVSMVDETTVRHNVVVVVFNCCWLLLISPQIIHIGFLFILLAHLLSAVGGFQRLTAAREGTYLKVSEGNFIHVKNIDIRTNSSGYTTDWAVRVEFIDGGKTIREDIIKPNKPSLHRGLNINVKDLRGFPQKKAALLQVNREPGAFWALIGGILVMAGTAILIILKIKIEK